MQFQQGNNTSKTVLLSSSCNGLDQCTQHLQQEVEGDVTLEGGRLGHQQTHLGMC